MASFNRLILMGNLTRDPELKKLNSGQSVCRLGLAVNDQRKNSQTGAVVQEVMFIDIDVWGAQAESCSQYLQKGRAILVDGRLKFDTWTDATGQTKTKHSMVAEQVKFLSSPTTQEASTDQRSSFTKSVTPARTAQDNELEQGLLQQIDQIKTRTQAKKVAATPAGLPTEIDFQDTPPFQDELPF